MRKKFTHKEWWNRKEKIFTSLEFDGDGKVILSKTGSMIPGVDITRNFGIWEDDGVLYDSNGGSLTISYNKVPIFLFYLNRRKVESVTFTFILTPLKLRQAVEVMRRLDLDEWIGPGLEYLVENIPSDKGRRSRKALIREARKMLLAFRDGPPSP